MPVVSPFTHDRESKRGYSIYTPAETLRQFQDKERARFTLEKLRFRGYERRGTLDDWMQRWGDWGRKYFFNPIQGMRIWW